MTVRVWTADRVLTGDRGAVIDDGAVAVEGNTIVWVGPTAELPGSLVDGAEIVTLPDVTLLPGLIDAHVHLGFDASLDPVRSLLADTDDTHRQRIVDNAAELLRVGVTTARDLGSRGYVSVEVRNAILAGSEIGPRLVVSGPPLTTVRGHCWFLGGECASRTEMLGLVRTHAARGVDLIKVMVSGGFMTPGRSPHESQIGTDDLVAVVRAAHEQGLRVAAHAHGSVAIADAVRAGVDTVEHCSFATEGAACEPDLEVIGLIVKAGTVVCPTVNVRHPELAAILGPERMPPIGLLWARGVPLVAGTDAGIGQVVHRGYVGGLEALVWYGVPPADVLVAATSAAADALGISGTTGRLKVGLDADVIAVKGDPRDDIAALRNLSLILVRGRSHLPGPNREIAAYELAPTYPSPPTDCASLDA
ncbi:amidohydrolase family protein [Aeromicrobium panaciterrae]|uniref:amidohydrolase family protein n=1 Tax=Aeromicrobium panaciterrae TaxID=363861 RepID=UPI0031DFF2B6